jgi:hypothetical protein
MTGSAARSTWYSAYAYRYPLNNGQEMPDLRTLPAQAIAERTGLFSYTK